MHNLQDNILSSMFYCYDSHQWATFSGDFPVTITQKQLKTITGLVEELTIAEVHRIYNPLIRLISYYIQSRNDMNIYLKAFIGENKKTYSPFIIGIAGSVSAGKSTLARLLLELLRRIETKPKVVLIPTDVFLYSNSVLEEKNLMMRKGFPESYDVARLIRFLADVKKGKDNLRVPVYSHLYYDIMPNQTLTISHSDIVIVEGLNVLQTNRMLANHDVMPFVSDFFDFSIYLDACPEHLEQWYIDRFLKLRQSAFSRKESFFHRFSQLSDEEAVATARDIWLNINLPNLHYNIAPTKFRANIILQKNIHHEVDYVMVGK